MGVDFIREQSGKAWRKRWDKGLDRLKMPSMFDVQFSEQLRTVSADLDSACAWKIGDQVVIQCNGPHVIVCDGQRRVGSIASIPAQIQSAIECSGGIALGTVERMGMFGNNAELSIR